MRYRVGKGMNRLAGFPKKGHVIGDGFSWLGDSGRKEAKSGMAFLSHSNSHTLSHQQVVSFDVRGMPTVGRLGAFALRLKKPNSSFKGFGAL